MDARGLPPRAIHLSDAGPSSCVLLQLSSGRRRLLLNACEGLQRLSCERGLRLHRDLDGVVLCSLSPSAVEAMAGQLEALMTCKGAEQCADAGTPLALANVA